ncbi:MAG: DNA recombination/repair protein RecA, partial [Actinobacteria bacterium]|nr:DNA recombination/repair protein RecA [Actinomycetota bacterium]
MAYANREPQDDKKEDKRSSDRSKSLYSALAQTERQVATGSVMTMGDRNAVGM